MTTVEFFANAYINMSEKAATYARECIKAEIPTDSPKYIKLVYQHILDGCESKFIVPKVTDLQDAMDKKLVYRKTYNGKHGVYYCISVKGINAAVKFITGGNKK